ncbi:neural proliferation differentiation and control protein 1a [Aplochiton taeniatus]
MLLSKRIDRQSWASLLPGVLLCLVLANVSASMPAGSKCPHHIDCAREGRHFCQAGTSHCGPCLTPLEENGEGHCVPRKRHHHNVKAESFPNVEAEIDYLHSVITKQKGSDVQQPEQPVMISMFILVGTVAMVLAAVCWVRLQRESRLAQKTDYPAYNGKIPASANGTGDSLGDKTLAQNAQMYHYQHQKQQMLSMGKPKTEPKVPESEATSDEEEVGGGFTVYECPGLAPTGEMEVKNPLFDDSTLRYQGNH